MMEAGSGVTIITLCWASILKYITLSEIPAEVSMSITSKEALNSSISFSRKSFSELLSLASSGTPTAAGNITTPSGPSMSTSLTLFSPENTCFIVCLGARPSIISMLAKPRSASSIITRCPSLDMASAVFVTILVLPTPPFPLLKDSTLGYFEVLSFIWTKRPVSVFLDP